MSFSCDEDAVGSRLKLEEGNQVVAHELRTDGTANQVRELFGAHGEVLADLDSAQSVSGALRLHGEDVVRASAVHTDIHFICLDLAYSRDCCAQVILQRVAGYAGENIY